MKCNIVDIMTELLCYYGCSLRVGHSHTMLQGADYTNCVILAARGAHIAKSPCRVVPLDDLRRLKGSRLPLAWDNTAITQLLHMALEEIKRLEALTPQYKIPAELMKRGEAE